MSCLLPSLLGTGLLQALLEAVVPTEFLFMPVGGPRAGPGLSLPAVQAGTQLVGLNRRINPRIHRLRSRPCWAFAIIDI